MVGVRSLTCPCDLHHTKSKERTTILGDEAVLPAGHFWGSKGCGLP